jgi:hypothetical protein
MNKDLTKPAGDDLSIEIQQLKMQIAALKKSKDEGTLTEAGSTYLDEMTKKQFKLIEQKVLLVRLHQFVWVSSSLGYTPYPCSA